MVATRRGQRNEAVRSPQTPGATRAKQTPSPRRTSSRIAARHDTATPTPAKNGDADGSVDVPRPPNVSTDGGVGTDGSGLVAEASGGASTPTGAAGSRLPEIRKFPAATPQKRKITNVDQALFDEGYDSDGQLPFYYDYSSDSSGEGGDGVESSDDEGGREAGVRPDSPAPADLAGAPSSKPGDLDPEELKKWTGEMPFKTRCGKFKRDGDGLQADCLASRRDCRRSGATGSSRRKSPGLYWTGTGRQGGSAAALTRCRRVRQRVAIANRR